MSNTCDISWNMFSDDCGVPVAPLSSNERYLFVVLLSLSNSYFILFSCVFFFLVPSLEPYHLRFCRLQSRGYFLYWFEHSSDSELVDNLNLNNLDLKLLMQLMTDKLLGRLGNFSILVGEDKMPWYAGHCYRDLPVVMARVCASRTGWDSDIKSTRGYRRKLGGNRNAKTTTGWIMCSVCGSWAMDWSLMKLIKCKL